MEFESLVKERYSVRKFQDRKVETSKIKELLEVLRYVPTAVNAEPEKVYVLESRESLEKIGTLANTFQAPVVLLICSDKNVAWKNYKEEGYSTYEMDGSIVATYLMLASWNLGLGSVWIRSFNANDVKKEFGLPENIQPICLLSIGYIHEKSVPSERHSQKKELKDLVEYF